MKQSSWYHLSFFNWIPTGRNKPMKSVFGLCVCVCVCSESWYACLSFSFVISVSGWKICLSQKKLCKQEELGDTLPRGSKTIISLTYAYTCLLGFKGLRSFNSDRDGIVEWSVNSPTCVERLYLIQVNILVKLPSHFVTLKWQVV